MELSRAPRETRIHARLTARASSSRERGAAVFIVMLSLLLLSGLGVWALETATLVDQASGYNRASLQTQYTAELGVQAGTAFLGMPGWATAHYNAGLSRPDPCESTQGLVVGTTGRPFCKSIYMQEIDSATYLQTQRNLLETGVAGSLSPFASVSPASVQGDFVLEMTDPQRAIVPGSDLSRSSYYRVTLTSRGIVRPRPAAAGALCEGNSSQNSSAGRIGVRAHTIIGPI